MRIKIFIDHLPQYKFDGLIPLAIMGFTNFQIGYARGSFAPIGKPDGDFLCIPIGGVKTVSITAAIWSIGDGKLFYLKDPGENMKLLDQAWTKIKAP